MGTASVKLLSTRAKGKLYQEISEDKDRVRAGLASSWLLSWEVSSMPLLETTAPLSGPSPTKHFLFKVLVTKHSFLCPVLFQSSGSYDSKLQVQVPA